MSYASEIRDELGSLTIKNACCRRAYLYGLLYCAHVNGDTVEATFSVIPGVKYDPATHAAIHIHALFSRNAEVSFQTRGAHRYALVSFHYRVAAKHLAELASLPEEEAAAETLAGKLDFRCEGCAPHFLRGLMVASGTVNDPAKSFHMELKLPDDGRVEPVRILLSESGLVPGITRRGEQVGLFFKSAGDIQTVLGHIGSTGRVFDYFNAQIERDIRNNENRATNCVTENISRSMRAGNRQISAVQWLEEQGLLLSLSEELRTTARLRLDHPEVTLTELAALHTPAITKSGVHHRMEKIMAFCEKARNARSDQI